MSRVTPACISLRLVVGDEDASEQGGGCSFGATEVPVGTRFQSSRTGKMAFMGSSKQAFAQQVKATHVLIILFYIYAVSLFMQILK